MLQTKNDPLYQYSIDLERENEKLKNDVRKRDMEINRLVAWKQNHTDTCVYKTCYDSDEFGKYQYMSTTCCGEIGDDDYNVDWTYCPYCGGEIDWKDQYEENRVAYEMHVDAEIDRRLGK